MATELEAPDKPTKSRRRFLRQIGLTLGVGVGALAVPAVARATLYQCCPQACISCETNWHSHFCECEWGTYCLCFPNSHCRMAAC